MPGIMEPVTGTVCWVEVNTTDTARARAFYTDLFGWKAQDMPSSGGGQYTTFSAGGRQVAGLMELPDQARKMGAPPHWLSYIAVEDAAACAEKTRQLGGNVLAGPMDVGMGVMDVLQDPSGGVFGVWQPKQSMGSFLYREPGAMCWNELASSNVDAAGKFYLGLFGWKARSTDMGGMTYTLLSVGETDVGGMMPKPKEMGDAPSMWTAYFAVESTDKTVAKTKELGGNVLAPAMDIPNVGRFAILADPTGAVFGVLQPSM